jgi:hypothetical protein
VSIEEGLNENAHIEPPKTKSFNNKEYLPIFIPEDPMELIKRDQIAELEELGFLRL